MTQNLAIVNYMKKHDSTITSMEAFKELGITRLSARIYDLRNLGYVIDSRDIMGRNRYGHAVRYAEYLLIREPKHEVISD